MAFPAQCGEFDRAALRYDPTGQRIAVAYNLRDGALPVAALVHVSPSPSLRTAPAPKARNGEVRERLAAQEFEAAKAEFSVIHPGAVLLGEDRTESSSGTASRVGFARYTYLEETADQPLLLETLVYVRSYAAERWTIKYTITFPAGADASAPIAELMRGLRRATENAAL